MKINRAYIDFIKYAVGAEAEVPATADAIDWRDFLDYCNRQGVIGLAFDGIQRANIRIEREMLFEWMAFSTSVKKQNAVVDKRIGQAVKWFDGRGRRSCILKGQANATMYPNPELRSPGDIDLWVEGKESDIIRMVLEIAPDAHYSIHHIKFPVFDDVSVEVHYRPMYLSNWFVDKRLQRYIGRIADRQFGNKKCIGDSEVGCLTDDFNVVYQILHMYAHFFSTRNNWKQFVDYYMLLKVADGNYDREETRELFRRFGVLKYASGVMWIMGSVLGLEDDRLVVEPNEREGRLILKESFRFGTWSENKLYSVVEQFAANFRIVAHYPKEVLISPLFLLWHQWWRIRMGWKLKR